VDADWAVLDGVHIGATWRIRLNHPCVQPCSLMSNYFDHLLNFPQESNERVLQLAGSHEQWIQDIVPVFWFLDMCSLFNARIECVHKIRKTEK